MEEETEFHRLQPSMPQIVIGEKYITASVRKIAVWRAPGPDKIESEKATKESVDSNRRTNIFFVRCSTSAFVRLRGW